MNSPILQNCSVILTIHYHFLVEPCSRRRFPDPRTLDECRSLSVRCRLFFLRLCVLCPLFASSPLSPRPSPDCRPLFLSVSTRFLCSWRCSLRVSPHAEFTLPWLVRIVGTLFLLPRCLPRLWLFTFESPSVLPSPVSLSFLRCSLRSSLSVSFRSFRSAGRRLPGTRSGGDPPSASSAFPTHAPLCAILQNYRLN